MFFTYEHLFILEVAVNNPHHYNGPLISLLRVS